MSFRATAQNNAKLLERDTTKCVMFIVGCAIVFAQTNKSSGQTCDGCFAIVQMDCSTLAEPELPDCVGQPARPNPDTSVFECPNGDELQENTVPKGIRLALGFFGFDCVRKIEETDNEDYFIECIKRKICRVERVEVSTGVWMLMCVDTDTFRYPPGGLIRGEEVYGEPCEGEGPLEPVDPDLWRNPIR